MMKFFADLEKNIFICSAQFERAPSKAHKQLLRRLHDIPSKCGNKSKISGPSAGVLANHHCSDFYIFLWVGKPGTHGPGRSNYWGSRSNYTVAIF